MNLESLRQEIDSVDEKLVELLEKRMSLISQIVDYKRNSQKAVLDLDREQEVLRSVSKKISNPDFESTIIAIFSNIMKLSRDYQNSKGLD